MNDIEQNKLKGYALEEHVKVKITEMYEKGIKINFSSVAKYCNTTTKFLYHHPILIVMICNYENIQRASNKKLPNRGWENFVIQGGYATLKEELIRLDDKIEYYQKKYPISEYEAYAYVREHSDFRL